MEDQLINNATISRPQDKSVEAYKTWIMEIAQRLTTGEFTVELTEIEWKQNWRDYWDKSLPVRSRNALR